MDLSVIIVNWNTKSLLLDCLNAVEAAIERSRIQTEVFIVDNASNDGSVDAVRNAFPKFRVVENTENMGFSRANNIALKFAIGDYCLLLNSDTVVPVDLFDQLTTVMKQHNQTAVCSPLLLNRDRTPQICWARFPGIMSELTGQLDRSQSPYPLPDFESPTRRSAMDPFPVDWVGGACFLVRREAMQEAGLLDEGFFMYSEETEWCHRFATRGWQTVLVPSITVTHLGGQSAKAVPTETRKQMYRSIVRLYKIFYGTFGSIFPSAIATVRFSLSALRERFRRWSAVKPVQ
ncbi:MAG: glycosyltransferase family 2 protein [Akkermansiaceae bacterium]|nr:glycosyltransferase family 2 protein [Armatimonadota bacterium]